MGEIADPRNLELLTEFILPPESLVESFEWPSDRLVEKLARLRGWKWKPQKIASSNVDNVEFDSSDSSSSNDGSDSQFYRKRIRRRDLTVKGLLRNLLLDIAHDPLVKYWVGLLTCVLVIDFIPWIKQLIWFILGVGLCIICNRGLSPGFATAEDESDTERGRTGSATSSGISLFKKNGAFSTGQNSDEEQEPGQEKLESGDNRTVLGSGLGRKSQGWLLTLDSADLSASPKRSSYPTYTPLTSHLKDTKVVFVRLNGPYLTLSVPHAKHRIPKRRLWNDPPINGEHLFIRHLQFDLSGAKVTIVPQHLEKRKTWNKKYPIGITFASGDKYCGVVNEGDLEDVNCDPSSKKVTFSDDELKAETDAEKPKGKVFKKGNSKGQTIYLFARCDREKDDWFRRLVLATKPNSPSTIPPKDISDFFTYMHRMCPTLTLSQSLFTAPPSETVRATPTKDLLYESVSMHHLRGDDALPKPSAMRSNMNILRPFHFTPNEGISPKFLNAFTGRLFYDFLKSEMWHEKVKRMIDKRLFNLKKPVVIQSLTLKNLEMGDSLPLINHASSPSIDSQGLWIDLDIGYAGNVVITLEAFVNPFGIAASTTTVKAKSVKSIKSKSKEDVREKESNQTLRGSSTGTSRVSSKQDLTEGEDNDSDDSSDSMDDVDLEEEKPEQDNANTGGGRLQRYAEKLAKSSVMRNKHVQKVINKITTTPLLLTVEIMRVTGSIALNIPPVPSDRVWIGFKTNPTVDIKVKPKVGQRMVSSSHVTEWIKKRILLEFQRLMVCPNMTDITIPVMEFKLPK